MNVDGDLGFNTNIEGPAEFEVDLAPDDINDLMASAFGFGGYAAKGKWMIQYSLSMLELEDDPTLVIQSHPDIYTTIYSEFGFDTTGAEITVGYMVFENETISLRLIGGVRFTKHELEYDLKIVGRLEDVLAILSGNDIEDWTQSNDIDEDWTDALVGASIGIPLSDKWVWNTTFNAGFGGSEGTYLANTGLTWRFHKRWTATFYGKITAVEYENEDKGDADWYLYDADEFGWGITVLFNW